MKNYIDLLNRIVKEGHTHEDRTGVGRRSIFGTELRFDLSEGKFPLVTTRKMYMRGIIEELLWFISGSTVSQTLIDKNVHLWDQWTVAPEHVDQFIAKFFPDITEEENVQAQTNLSAYVGTIGRLYGASFRNAPAGAGYNSHKDFNFDDLASDKKAIVEKAYNSPEYMAQFDTTNPITLSQIGYHIFGTKIDQIQNLITGLKKRPWSSRHCITAWIPETLADEELSPEENVLIGRGALAPCHVFQQYFVTPPKEEGGKLRLSLKMTQRSSDFCIGVPSNIASYSLLLMMIAQCVDMEPLEFIWSSGDTHIYSNHIDLVGEQIAREPLPLPTMRINPEVKDIFSFTIDDFVLENYTSAAAIKYPVAT